MENSTIIALSGYIFSVITGVASWIAGTRSRRNSVYQEMMKTIQELTKQNNDLHQNIIDLQNEVIEVRKENAELKAGQEKMTRKIEDLENGGKKTIGSIK